MPPSAPDAVVQEMRAQIVALQEKLERQSRELTELRERARSEAAQPTGPSREKLQAICDKTFGKGIANVLGIRESPEGETALGEIRIFNLAVQGTIASGKADARISHYNDGRWVLKSIRLYAVEGGRYAWDFEVEL